MKRTKKLLTAAIVIAIICCTALSMSITVSAARNYLFPMKNGTLAFAYGYSESYGGWHTGIDIHSGGDNTIYAAYSGTVTMATDPCPHYSYGGDCGHYNTYGNCIRIAQDDGKIGIYGHLSQGSLLVKVGDYVKTGQPIATMGSSGWSTGPHLHFEVRNSTTYGDDINVNPTSMGGEITYSYSGYGSASSSTPISYSSITTGNYFIKNKADGNYLNISYGEDKDGTLIHTYQFGNYDAQVFNIYKASDGYEIMPLCSSTRVVNSYCWEVISGKTVNLYTKSNDSSQWWRFQVSGDGYVIRNVQNPNVCLTSVTDGLIVSTYTGASSQLWYLEKACTIKYNANGGSGAPSSQRVRAGYSTAISTTSPTKKCNIFSGWSTSATASASSVKKGGSFTVQNDTTLYAVWTVNHSYSSWTQTTAPTCTEKGLETRTCNTCNTKETRTVTAKSHSFSTNFMQDKAPTCTETGSKSYHCTKCNAKTNITVISATGHIFGSWVTKKAATTESAGLSERTCQNKGCGKTEQMTIAKLPKDKHSHTYGTWTTVTKATCTQSGTDARFCITCNEKETVTTPMISHKFDEGVITKEPSVFENGIKTYSCLTCDKTRTEDIAVIEMDLEEPFPDDTVKTSEDSAPFDDSPVEEDSAPNDGNPVAEKEPVHTVKKSKISFLTIAIITITFAVATIGGSAAWLHFLTFKKK